MFDTFLGNNLYSWGRALAVAFGATLAVLLVKELLLRALRTIAARTRSDLDDIALVVLSSTGKLFIGAIALYAGAQMLALPARAAALVHGISMVALFLQAALWGDLAVKEWLERYRTRYAPNL